ncbi:MAG: type II secretion system protein [Patescibacteria group bacterium]
MFRKSLGFTLVEMALVAGIISIMTAVLYVNFTQGSAQTRDSKRKTDLIALQNAVELYKQKNGTYPQGCNGPSTSAFNQNNWSGQRGTSYACPGGSAEYITGLAPEFIKVLPKDPKLNGTASGYVYTVNQFGTAYKIMALDTVESEVIGLTHQFARCGDAQNNGSHECSSVPPNAGANPNNALYNQTGSTPGQCSTPSEFNNDYAVVGGFAGQGQPFNTVQANEFYSDVARCK